MSTYHHIQKRNPDPMDIIIILLFIAIIFVSGVALYNAGKEIAKQMRAYQEIGSIFESSWTGHNETKLLALNLTWEKLGRKKEQPEYRKAFMKLVKIEAPNPSAQSKKSAIKSAQSMIPKPIL